MAVFEYKGVNASGKSVGGIIDAESPRLARQKLRSDGIFPTEVTEEEAQKRSPEDGKRSPVEEY